MRKLDGLDDFWAQIVSGGKGLRRSGSEQPGKQNGQT